MNTDRPSRAKKYVLRSAVFVLIAAVLAVAYFSAEDITPAPDSGTVTTTSVTDTTVQSAQTDNTTDPEPPVQTTATSLAADTETTPPTATVTTSSNTETTISQTTTTTTTTAAIEQPPAAKTCSFLISCASAVGSPDKLRPGVLDILPRDGIIFSQSEVALQEGDTVYDVLVRVCKQKGIQIETQKVAATNSVYIEGIANLYEFDAGELSGWMFSVDGKFPQTSCSLYELKGGERVEILYSCNIGADVGDDFTRG